MNRTLIATEYLVSLYRIEDKGKVSFQLIYDKDGREISTHGIMEHETEEACEKRMRVSMVSVAQVLRMIHAHAKESE